MCRWKFLEQKWLLKKSLLSALASKSSDANQEIAGKRVFIIGMDLGPEGGVDLARTEKFRGDSGTEFMTKFGPGSLKFGTGLVPQNQKPIGSFHP